MYSTYTVWYVRQLKLLVLRQNRKFVDGEARNGRIFFWNQLLMKSSLCSCAWLKWESFTSPRASRAFDKAWLLLLEAWNFGEKLSEIQFAQYENQCSLCCEIGFTMVVKISRAWSRTEEVLWKKSFQTSTGYFSWLSREHFMSVARLFSVRCAALGGWGIYKEQRKPVSEL